jgi:hypothetical protein
MSIVHETGVVLVCGSRHEKRVDKVWAALDLGFRSFSGDITLVVTGAADGIDTLALDWARYRCIPFLGIPAQWDKFGHSAGPRRNGFMANLPIQVVWCFPGGKGTESMIQKATAASIPLYKVPFK